MRRKQILCVSVVIVAAACFLSCEGLRWDVFTPIEKEGRHVYAAAYAYPENYDWRRDSLGGKVAARLLYYKDTSLLLDLEASAGNGISLDADMHRIVNGDLYCEYSSSSGTTLFKNGSALLSFSGREALAGLIVADSVLYTLWEDRSGDGWTYRENGRVVLRGQSSSALLGGLYDDGGTKCFSYFDRLSSTSGKSSSKRYFIVEDGKARQLNYSMDIDEILCVRRHCGTDNYLASSERLGILLWQCGEKIVVIDTEDAVSAGDCFFEKCSGELLAHAQLREDYGIVTFWNDRYWKFDALAAKPFYTGQLCAVCHDSPVLCFAYSAGGGSGGVRVQYGGEEEGLPSHWRLVSPYALCCDDEGWMMGVSSSGSGGHPMIVSGKDSVDYGFNGYFTHLSLP